MEHEEPLPSVKLDDSTIDLPIPSGFRERSSRDRRRSFEGPGGVVLVDVETEARLVTPALLRDVVQAHEGAGRRVTEQRLVDVQGRVGLRISGAAGSTEWIQYQLQLDTRRSARVTYLLESDRVANALRRELASSLEATPNRFERVLDSPNLSDSGVLVWTQMPMPARWVVVGEQGECLSFPNPDDTEVVPVDVTHSAVLVIDPDRAGPGAGDHMRTRLAGSGPADASLVARCLAEMHEWVGSHVLVREQRTAHLRISDEEAHKAVVDYVDAAGRSIVALVYLVRDELAYTWQIIYAVRAERAAKWLPVFETIEVKAVGLA
jgi:hypothetical protein